jgi:hypothetical protein
MSTSWPVKCGDGEALVRGRPAGPRVDVDGSEEGECEYVYAHIPAVIPRK